MSRSHSSPEHQGSAAVPSDGAAGECHVRYRAVAGDGFYRATVTARHGNDLVDIEVHIPFSEEVVTLHGIPYHRGAADTCPRGSCHDAAP